MDGRRRDREFELKEIQDHGSCLPSGRDVASDARALQNHHRNHVAKFVRPTETWAERPYPVAMAPTLQPIKLSVLASGPNPWKVVIIMLELGLDYELELEDMISVKEPPYEKLNPNGRCPTIQDPNTGITLWESGAIVQYLIDQYDTTHKISFDTFPEKYHTQQYLYYQVSGQGPYTGQAAWFTLYHSEDVPSARSRYQAEAKRIIRVLDGILRDREWLVGDRCSYADLSFITWAAIAPNILGTSHEEINKECPNYGSWLKKMNERTSVIDMLKEKDVIAPPNKRYQLDHKIDDEQKKKMDEEVKLAKRGSEDGRNGVSNGCSNGASTGFRPGETCNS